MSPPARFVKSCELLSELNLFIRLFLHLILHGIHGFLTGSLLQRGNSLFWSDGQ